MVKEIEEELGYRIDKLDRLFELYMSPAGFMEKITFFTCRYSIVPIFGTRRLDRVKESLGAAEVSLSDEDMAAIEARLAGIEVIGERLPPDLLKVTYR
jgi:8-oxo-dGTP pyrophosphatase MutT (NUDIX family)